MIFERSLMELYYKDKLENVECRNPPELELLSISRITTTAA